MAFCGGCGAAVQPGSAFCGSCGKSVATTAGVSGAAAAAAPAPASVTPGLTTNVAAALAYLLGAVTGVLFLVLEPYRSNRFVRFHAMQSIVFSVACVVFAIAWDIVWGILASTVGFWVLTIDLPLRLLISLGSFGLWLFVMFQAYNNREYRIPFLGQIVARQAQ